ncbi:unknown [Orgyia pseudotsugata multiple nucleopolyhedrovirus]|uniref:Uncharacterized 9.4 kDa protein n=1 Tax=Orgyia pseudotsugata multicapsid polyhedrosis virus TaxID=262177 RepID=Y073_NPVOP|nr:hypothetical protein OpmnVgp076 [Orgyia pseudotsugata multiple nucleopolyhedrovirus]O10326.1 RecName: Full=Uncharacterized 9.4 kDa protein [Orgyia pseudotsugata multiple nucleopolyhedrovirus]pir/T10345/ hypothetical protein 76 - Orgyia pseudotsugata nuclear polyhedrosis virus [Orgyia pseudotsugata single capsid nuclopolyhedrovirus]AAC59075.1 unknown [Orgyia pseudotsugata multiple nucleopolyhedrovirus]
MTPQAALLDVQSEALHLASEVNAFLTTPNSTDFELILTKLSFRARAISFDEVAEPRRSFYESLKLNCIVCINVLIDIVLLKINM